MPFLRVVRDHRGIEHTYLMELVRNRGRQRSRVLYVFRNVPGLKVGRDPFDPDTRQLIERANPDIAFDWDALIKSLPPPEAEPDTRRPLRRGRRGPKEASAPPAPPQRLPRETREQSVLDESPVPDTAPALDVPDGSLEPVERDRQPAPAPVANGSPIAAPREDALPTGPRFPRAIEGETTRARLAWLRVWHLETVARIEQEFTDEPRRSELLRIVARLDPSAWSDPAAIDAGFADATTALDELAEAFDRQHRS